jgi:diguanylate cyclase (GGDEF)-like protein
MHTAKAGAGQGERPAHADHHEHQPEIVAPRSSGDRPLHSVTSARRRCESCGQLIADRPTGLIERWHWDEAAADIVAGARAGGESIALIMIDLDRFKEVNDSYGHLAGDAVLRAVADVIRETTRDGGSAGDEFLVLLPSSELDEALGVAEQIRAGITGMSVTAKVTRELSATIEGQTASIGVATYNLGDLVELDLEDLMLDADVSLRAAKRHGRDRICVANMDVTGSRVSSGQAGKRFATWSRFRRLRSV